MSRDAKNTAISKTLHFFLHQNGDTPVGQVAQNHLTRSKIGISADTRHPGKSHLYHPMA